MSEQVYDCAIIGLGVMGLSAAAACARGGLSVLGIEQYTFAHEKGSSHGETRIIRKAYYEHPSYVPLLMESYRLWAELERRSQTKIFEQCGLFYALRADGEILGGLRQSQALYGIRVEEGAGVCPHPFSLDSRLVQLFEPEAGFLRVDPALKAFHGDAIKNSARLHFEEALVGFVKEKSGFFKIKTSRSEYAARKIVFSTGAWNKHLFSELGVSLSLIRKILVWASAPRGLELGAGASCFFLETQAGVFYGFPSIDADTGSPSFKFAEHDHAADDEIERASQLHYSEYNLSRQKEFLGSTLPQHELAILRSKACLYTMAEDSHFVVDFHPSDRDIVLCSPCSGHGFKFAPVVGRMICDMLKTQLMDPLGAFMNFNRLLVADVKQR